MKTKKRKKAAQRQRALQARLAHRDFTSPCQPLLGDQPIRYELAARTRVVSMGGLGLIHGLVMKLQLPAQEVHDHVLERTIGAFGHVVGARYQTPMMMHCCTANASQGLYYAWEGILRCHGTSAEVNLWLNRRSPWADVWSWLPHEGKLLIQNKGMRQLTVRKPSWALRTRIRCQVNGQDAEPRWAGGRMIFDGLQGTETLLITTPVNVESATYTMVNLADPQHSREQYRCEFRGHTAVGVQRLVAGNDPHEHSWYHLFRREGMAAAAPPGKRTPPYVHPEKLVNWLMLV